MKFIAKNIHTGRAFVVNAEQKSALEGYGSFGKHYVFEEIVDAPIEARRVDEVSNQSSEDNERKNRKGVRVGPTS